jgi:RNA polymerase-binding transcription factor DksA
VAAAETTTAAGVAGDPFDRIERTESRERSLDARERLTDRLDRIVEAMERLDDGSYGTCAVCGEEIAPRRLHAISPRPPRACAARRAWRSRAPGRYRRAP